MTCEHRERAAAPPLPHRSRSNGRDAPVQLFAGNGHAEARFAEVYGCTRHIHCTSPLRGGCAVQIGHPADLSLGTSMCLSPWGRLRRANRPSCRFVTRHIHVPLPLGAAAPCKSAVLPICHSAHPCASPLGGGCAVQIGSPADLSNRVLVRASRQIRKRPLAGPLRIWRRGRDSNPRRAINPCLISSQVHSTTLPPLRWSPAVAAGGVNDTGPAAAPQAHDHGHDA